MMLDTKRASKCVSTVFLCSIFTALPAQSQEAIFIIRHAEKAVAIDPPLSAAGVERAHRWAEMFASAGVDYVYTSEALRTRETGGIIAEALGVGVEAYPTNDPEGLIEQIGDFHADDVVVVVGHTETIPDMLSALGAFDLYEWDLSDYARFFVVVPGDGVPVMLDMRMP